MKDIRWILEVQAKTARTPKGRTIGEPLLPEIENSMNNPKLAEASMVACRNCGLVLDEGLFADGCKNCRMKGEWDRIEPR